MKIQWPVAFASLALLAIADSTAHSAAGTDLDCKLFMSEDAPPSDGIRDSKSLDSWLKDHASSVKEVGSFANDGGALRFNYYTPARPNQVKSFSTKVDDYSKPDSTNPDCGIENPAFGTSWACTNIGSWTTKSVLGSWRAKTPIPGIDDGAALYLLSTVATSQNGSGQSVQTSTGGKRLLVFRGAQCGRFLTAKAANKELGGFYNDTLNMSTAPIDPYQSGDGTTPAAQ